MSALWALRNSGFKRHSLFKAIVFSAVVFFVNLQSYGSANAAINISNLNNLTAKFSSMSWCIGEDIIIFHPSVDINFLFSTINFRQINDVESETGHVEVYFWPDECYVVSFFLPIRPLIGEIEIVRKFVVPDLAVRVNNHLACVSSAAVVKNRDNRPFPYATVMSNLRSLGEAAQENECAFNINKRTLGGIGSALRCMDRSPSLFHLAISNNCKAGSSESKNPSCDEQKKSVIDQITSQLHRFTIQFGLFFLGYNLVGGLFFGYGFYYERRLLCAAIGIGNCLLVGFGLLWLL